MNTYSFTPRRPATTVENPSQITPRTKVKVSVVKPKGSQALPHTKQKQSVIKTKLEKIASKKMMEIKASVISSSIDNEMPDVQVEEISEEKISKEERAMCLARIFSTENIMQEKDSLLCSNGQILQNGGKKKGGQLMNPMNLKSININIDSESDTMTFLQNDFQEHIAKERESIRSFRRQNSADHLSCGSSFDALPKYSKHHLDNNKTSQKMKKILEKLDQNVSEIKDETKPHQSITTSMSTIRDQTISNLNPIKRKPIVRNVKYNDTNHQQHHCPTPNPQSYKSPFINDRTDTLEDIIKNVSQKDSSNYGDDYDDEFSEEEDECSYIEQEEKLAQTLTSFQGVLYKNIIDEKKKLSIYKTRYGVIKNKRFKYYKDSTMKQLGGILDFDRIQCVIMIDDGFQHFRSEGEAEEDFQEPVKFRIEVIGCKRQFIFEVPDSNLLRQWTHALYANWHASKSFKMVNQLSLLNTKFWKYDMITEQDFKKIADTGDILLFKGSSFVTKVQRAITLSEYDHVAMMLRYSNGKLVIFESTGSTGVAVLDWEIFVRNNWQSLYAKLAFRKLRYNRSLDSMQKLESFIKNVIGKKYKLNASKIFKKKDENDSENITDDKSYFCSELVASAYKCLGILPKDISGSQYWPGNFSNKGGMVLQEEAVLEDEQTIEFYNP